MLGEGELRIAVLVVVRMVEVEGHRKLPEAGVLASHKGAARMVEEGERHSLAVVGEHRSLAVEVDSRLAAGDTAVVEEDILFPAHQLKLLVPFFLLCTYDRAAELASRIAEGDNLGEEARRSLVEEVAGSLEGDILCASLSVQLLVSPQILDLRPGGGAP